MKLRRNTRAAAVLLAVCLLVTALLGGCTGNETSIIGYDLPGSFRSLDPQTANDAAAHQILHSLFEGLFTPDAEGEPIPAAAESHSVSGDGLTYTFRLREDAQWTYPAEDGSEVREPVTAADFVFAFRRLFRPGTNESAAGRYCCIRNGAAVLAGTLPETELGVYADGERVLRIELETPNENFLRLLAETYAMPCNERFFETTRGRYGLDAETILSNGPFRMYRWEDDRIRLRRNENYRDAASVRPDELRFYPGQQTTGEEELQRLLDGTVHAAVLDGSLSGLTERGLNTEPLENSVWGIRVNWANPSLANANIRQAIALAFDRSSYESLLSGNRSPARAILPHGVRVGGESFRAAAGEDLTAGFAPTAAYERYRQGLAELERSNAGSLSLLVNGDAGVPAAELFAYVSQVLQRELSLYIKVEEVSGDVYGARLAAGDFDLAFCRLQADDSSPRSILATFLSGNAENDGGYSSLAFDTAMQMAALAGNDAAALAAYREAERILLEDAAFLPMFYSTDHFATRADTHGIIYDSLTGMVDFKGAYVD